MTTAATLVTLLTLKSGLLPFAEDLIKVKATGHITVIALEKEVRIGQAAKLAKTWKHVGLCPNARAEGHDLVLGCTTQRLHAEVSDGVVTITALRGLPWDADDQPAPRPTFQPEQVGLGGACPGTNPAGKAECLLHEGKTEAAREQLTAALGTMHRDYAALRFADLALEADKPLESMEWLEKAGRTGEWGRLASVRMCELSGRCFKGPQREALFDGAGLAAPLRDELKLRELRMLRFESPMAAMARLNELSGGAWPESLCSLGPQVCNDVVLGALLSSDVEARINALALFAAGPVTTPSPMRPRLAAAAADAALALGAPHYAASALAAATPDVPRPLLKAHLKKVIALYEAAEEPARAAAVRAYAMDAVGLKPAKGKKASPPRLVSTTSTTELFAVRETELAKELADAAVARARAKSKVASR